MVSAEGGQLQFATRAGRACLVAEAKPGTAAGAPAGAARWWAVEGGLEGGLEGRGEGRGLGVVLGSCETSERWWRTSGIFGAGGGVEQRTSGIFGEGGGVEHRGASGWQLLHAPSGLCLQAFDEREPQLTLASCDQTRQRNKPRSFSLWRWLCDAEQPPPPLQQLDAGAGAAGLPREMLCPPLPPSRETSLSSLV